MLQHPSAKEWCRRKIMERENAKKIFGQDSGPSTLLCGESVRQALQNSFGKYLKRKKIHVPILKNSNSKSDRKREKRTRALPLSLEDINIQACTTKDDFKVLLRNISRTLQFSLQLIIQRKCKAVSLQNRITLSSLDKA